MTDDLVARAKRASSDWPRGIMQELVRECAAEIERLRERALEAKALARAADTERAERLRAEAERDALRFALRCSQCPRPANARPEFFKVGDCVDADECGCMMREAIDAARGKR